MLYALDYLKRNSVFVLLAFSLISGAIVVVPFKEFIYYAGVIFLFSFAVRNNRIDSKRRNRCGIYYILFLAVCITSSCLALVLNYRLFAFIVLIVSCTPITNSYSLYIFRERYLYHCLMLFPIIALASVFCYFADINYLDIEGTGIDTLDFSAFFPHPLWLGAALGLSNVVLMWLLLSVRSRIYVTIFLIILLLSVYVSIVAASRSAFFGSILAMVVLILVKLHNLKKILTAGVIIAIFVVVFLPVYLAGASRMQNKFAESQGKYGSRTELFTSGLSHFEENPLLGHGFAIGYNAKGEKVVGRMESGSGWLSILLQTGIVGFIIVCILILKVRKTFPYMLNDDKLLLYFCSFLYLCFHSTFEGYLLTIGYYPCILFWTLLGFLHIYPYYKNMQFGN